jgi:hypothetical protein
MDGSRFDALSRSLAAGHSRRGLTRLLGSLALGGASSRLGVAESEAKKKHKPKKKACPPCKTRKKGKCKGLLPDGSACTGGTCQGGVCLPTPLPPPSPPPDPCAAPPLPTACTDGMKNGKETDIDCGGGTCLRCAVGKTCTSRQDCASARCVEIPFFGGTCLTCVDNITDCGFDADGTTVCGCRQHESGQRFCTKIDGRFLATGTCADCCVAAGEQCFPIISGGISCILPCGA